jgi:hypothetical protein
MGRKTDRDLFSDPGKISLPKDAYKRVDKAITERGLSTPKLQKLLGVTDETFLNARKKKDGKTQIPTVVMMALELADDLGVDWLKKLFAEPMYRAAFLTGTLSDEAQREVVTYIEWRYEQERQKGIAKKLNISENPSSNIRGEEGFEDELSEVVQETPLEVPVTKVEHRTRTVKLSATTPRTKKSQRARKRGRQ